MSNTKGGAAAGAEVVLLGTAGGLYPRPNRKMATVAVLVGGEAVLFDCGAGATYQMMEAGIDPLSIDYLFLTHHHSDHMLGYPQFVLTNWMMGGADPLHVFGPSRTERITELLFGEDGVHGEDIRSRIESNGQYLNRLRLGRDLAWPELKATDLDGSVQEIVRTENWWVTASRTTHLQPWIQSSAYRLDTGAGSVVVTGDTAPTDEIRNLAAGADILVHDCSHLDEVLEASKMEATHTGPAAGGRIANEAEVSTLVLFHFGAELDQPHLLEKAEAMARDEFDGDVVLAKDMMRLPLGNPIERA